MFSHVKIYPSDLPHLEHTHLNSLATTVHCHLTFEEDDNSSLDNNTLLARMEHHSPVEHPMTHHLTSRDEDKEGEEEVEHFPTAPLNDDVCMEEPVPDRHLFDFQDATTTASDEDIPNLEDVLQR